MQKKKLFHHLTSILTLFLVTSTFAYGQARDKLIEYIKPYTVLATLFATAESGDVILWAIPFEDDIEGNKDAKKMLKNASNLYERKNPYRFKMLPAGIKFAFSTEGSFKNNFNEDLTKILFEHYSGKDVGVVCYGGFNAGMPVCDAIDIEGVSLNESLVKTGFAVINHDLMPSIPEYAAKLQKAEEEAKSKEVGVWKPFHFMIHTLR